jgi:Rrf2 family protein
MRVTTKGRYGLRAMLELALHEEGEPVLMSNVAEVLGVSRKYLHAVLTALKSARLVRSVRGSGGGYCLARDPREINIAEILCTLEGCNSLVECVENANACVRCPTCVAHGLWTGLGQAIQRYLAGISLFDLAHGKADLGLERPPAKRAAQYARL